MGFSVGQYRKEIPTRGEKAITFSIFCFTRCRSSVMVTEREQAGVMTTGLSLMGKIRKTGKYATQGPNHFSLLFK